MSAEARIEIEFGSCAHVNLDAGNCPLSIHLSASICSAVHVCHLSDTLAHWHRHPSTGQRRNLNAATSNLSTISNGMENKTAGRHAQQQTEYSSQTFLGDPEDRANDWLCSAHTWLARHAMAPIKSYLVYVTPCTAGLATTLAPPSVPKISISINENQLYIYMFMKLHSPRCGMRSPFTRCSQSDDLLQKMLTYSYLKRNREYTADMNIDIQIHMIK